MTILDADLAICASCNRLNHRPVLSWLFGTVSRLGDGVFWYLLMLSMPLTGSGGWFQLLVMATAGITGTLTYKLTKCTTARVRPCEGNATLHLTIAPLDRFSFPSGHTLHAVCFTILATAYLPVLGIFLIPFTVLVALSRLVLGLHYPSDVLAGAAIGTCVAGTALMITG